MRIWFGVVNGRCLVAQLYNLINVQIQSAIRDRA